MLLRRLVTLIAAFAIAAPAHATITQTIGGPGGSPYEMRCPDGKAVVGVRASAGAWIDSIALLCAAPGSEDREQVGFAGGPGGSPQEAYCRAGEPSSEILMNFTRGNDLPRQYLDNLAFECPDGARCIQTDDSCDLSSPARGEKPFLGFIGSVGRDPPDFLPCPSDEVLIGLTGKAGNYIDSIAAICGPRPAARFILQSPGRMIGPGDVARGRVLGPGPAAHISSGPSPSHNVILRPAPRLPDVDRCKQGYVWREANPADHVCVAPDSRERVRVENRLAEMRRDPSGPYGPMTCKSGFVWREAFDGDAVCVEPEIRSLVHQENAEAVDHRE